MGKKVAVINDLSGFGRCSLTAAISVLSAMGVQACPLPTAVLSAQTGYEDYHCVSLTEEMEQFRRSWEKMEARFDGIYTGFAADEEQIGHMIHIAETFHKKKAFLLVDPIMGDHGYKFDIFSIEFCRKMRELAKMADIVTPNLTELCILTDTDYRMIENMTDEKHLLTVIRQLAENLRKDGPRTVVVTGIQFCDNEDGIRKMGNLAVTGKETHLAAFPYVGGSYSGTGDLFASVLAGGLARGENLMSSPGAGKTTTLTKTIDAMKHDFRIGVMEADIDSAVDADTISETGAKVIQLHTGGMCHLDADMTRQGLLELDTSDVDLAILENVGNLVCPAEFDTGAVKNAMILSVPEGDDKPLKYPLMFQVCQCLLINKIDVLPYFDFDLEECKKRVLKLNPDMKIIPISARTGEGMDEWIDWLKEETSSWNESNEKGVKE